VTFITGHDASGVVPDGIDWMSLGKGSPVIVLYMALKHIGQIAERLQQAGRKPDEPVAVVSKATTSGQRVLETTLAACATAVEASEIEPPAIVVVGEVVRLRAALDWIGALDGRTLTPDPLGHRNKTQVG
jgi:uroporphyrin-III C-methyltransferase